MKTVQKLPLNTFKFRTGYPYQRFGLSKISLPIPKVIKNADSIKCTGTECPYQRLYQTYISLVWNGQAYIYNTPTHTEGLN